MNARRGALVVPVAILLLAWANARPAGAQTGDAYPNMAPVDQYLMDRADEITLARSAAPPSISKDATVVVLGRHGYETVVQGTNGFVCGVERSWMNLFDSPEFWNPKVRGAICYNAPAARSVLPIVLLRAQLVLQGLPKEQIADRVKAAYAKKQLAPVEAGAMSYMLAQRAYLTDEVLTEDGAHSVAHVMIYTPLMDGKVWGAGLPGSPVHIVPAFNGAPEPIDIFIVMTGLWSDGTLAPLTFRAN